MSLEANASSSDKQRSVELITFTKTEVQHPDASQNVHEIAHQDKATQKTESHADLLGSPVLRRLPVAMQEAELEARRAKKQHTLTPNPTSHSVQATNAYVKTEELPKPPELAKPPTQPNYQVQVDNTMNPSASIHCERRVEVQHKVEDQHEVDAQQGEDQQRVEAQHAKVEGEQKPEHEPETPKAEERVNTEGAPTTAPTTPKAPLSLKNRCKKLVQAAKGFPKVINEALTSKSQYNSFGKLGKKIFSFAGVIFFHIDIVDAADKAMGKYSFLATIPMHILSRLVTIPLAVTYEIAVKALKLPFVDIPSNLLKAYTLEKNKISAQLITASSKNAGTVAKANIVARGALRLIGRFFGVLVASSLHTSTGILEDAVKGVVVILMNPSNVLGAKGGGTFRKGLPTLTFKVFVAVNSFFEAIKKKLDMELDVKQMMAEEEALLAKDKEDTVKVAQQLDFLKQQLPNVGGATKYRYTKEIVFLESEYLRLIDQQKWKLTNFSREKTDLNKEKKISIPEKYFKLQDSNLARLMRESERAKASYETEVTNMNFYDPALKKEYEENLNEIKKNLSNLSIALNNLSKLEGFSKIKKYLPEIPLSLFDSPDQNLAEIEKFFEDVLKGLQNFAISPDFNEHMELPAEYPKIYQSINDIGKKIEYFKS